MKTYLGEAPAHRWLDPGAPRAPDTGPADRTTDVDHPLSRVLDGLKTANPEARLTAAGADALERFVTALVTAQRQRPAPDWEQLLGPVVTSRVAAELLGTTQHSLARARAKGAVLGLRSTAGRWLYPLQQFDWSTAREIEVLDRLDEVLAALYAAGDEPAAARWLATPNRRLAGSTPWDVLRGGEGGAAVVAAAGAQAHSWAGR